MQTKKVTVVIPNYNGIKYIRGCMDSLHGQEGEPFDVIVIDNASTDGSLEVLQQEYSWARVIPLSENTGFDYADLFIGKLPHTEDAHKHLTHQLSRLKEKHDAFVKCEKLEEAKVLFETILKIEGFING